MSPHQEGVGEVGDWKGTPTNPARQVAPRNLQRAPSCSREMPPPTRPQSRGSNLRPPHARSAGAPTQRPSALPGAAVGRDKGSESETTPLRAALADLRGAPLPGRAYPDAAATLSSGGASGSRTALCLSSVMLGDPGATSREASSAAAGAGSSERVRADSTRPAPPRLSCSQDPPQPGSRRWNSAPPSAAAALSPGLSTVGLLQYGPLAPLGKSAPERARTRTAAITAAEIHQWRESIR